MTSVQAQALARPRLTLTVGLALTLALAAGLGQLRKDTSVDAFVPPGHPSLLANERIRQIFGVSDPMVVALMFDTSEAAFRPSSLQALRSLHQTIAGLDNVAHGGVTSLASESSISGTGESLDVVAYLPATGTLTDELAASALTRWRKMPPHQGTLVAYDASAFAIVVEIEDESVAYATYESIRRVAEAHRPAGAEIHVAGHGAVVGYLSGYIDRDSRTLIPLIYAVVLIAIYAAFRRIAGVLATLSVVLGSVAGTLGLMGWLQIPYFAITSALPVILVAIAVADAFHLLSAFYAADQSDPALTVREKASRAVQDVLRPVTLTTLTTVAAFIAIGVTAVMPPIYYFAWFAAIGVAMAWGYTVFVLPAFLIVLNPSPSPVFSRRHRARDHWLTRLAFGVLDNARLVVCGAMVLIAVAALGAMQLRVDRALVESFKPHEPIRLADQRINEAFAGTSLLDIVVETAAPDAALEPQVMQAVARLQAFMEDLPGVRASVGIVDYLSLMHAALHAQVEPGVTALPNDADALAQYLLLYEASADPTDFQEEIDPEYRRVLVRGLLNTRYFSDEEATVEALQNHLDINFDVPGVDVEMAGRVTVRYHWMQRLAQDHFTGVGLSLLLIGLVTALFFRSVTVGALCLIPVAVSVLSVYAVMGFTGVFLEPATTMFAAISLGVGVDFAAHLVERIRRDLADGASLSLALSRAMPITARACLFSALALGLGFSVLMFSELLTLIRFGAIVAVAAISSFVCTFLLVPLAFARVTRTRLAGALTQVTLILLVGAGAFWFPQPAVSDTFSPLEVAKRVQARAESEFARRELHMTLTDHQGRERRRRALVVRHKTAEFRKTLIVYTEPRRVRDTTLLGYDWSQDVDERWLYVPAVGKTRRIPATQRGANFLGTDFSYADVQSELKFDLGDYRFVAADTVGRFIALVAEPVTPDVARELGYGGFRALIDPGSWMPMEIEFTDPHGRRLKRVRVAEVDRIDGVWVARRIEATNYQTGHTTAFSYSHIHHPARLDTSVFSVNQLRRGLGRRVRRMLE